MKQIVGMGTEDINIPKKSVVKATFMFSIDGKPEILKIYESEVKIENKVIKQ